MTEQPTLTAAPDPTPTPAKDTAKKKADPTEYVILQRTVDGTWEEVGSETVQGSDAAIKKHLGETIPAATDAFVAVPARSWKPKSPEVEQTTTVRLV